MDAYTHPTWTQSALLTIDMQEDFSRPEGSAYIPGTEAILPALQKCTNFYRQKQWPIIHVIRLYKKDGANVDLCRRQQIERGAEIVAPDTHGARLVNELIPDQAPAMNADNLLDGCMQQLGPHEWMMYKPRWGAFYVNMSSIYKSPIASI